eukprot:2699975-Ditylum_brightwellii.AAC.1
MFYGDPPSAYNIPVLPSRQHERYNIPLSDSLANKNSSEMDNMSQEPENKYLFMHGWWKSNNLKRSEESTDGEKK